MPFYLVERAISENNRATVKALINTWRGGGGGGEILQVILPGNLETYIILSALDVRKWFEPLNYCPANDVYKV